MKRWNKLIATILACMMLFTAGAPAMAAVPDINMDMKGSLQVVVRDLNTKQPVAGGSLALYPVAELQKENGSYVFVLTEEFQAYGNIDNPEQSGLADKLADYAAKQQLQVNPTTIGQDGKASFTGLPLGLYLVQQTAKGSNNATFKPFLVVLPTSINSELQYSVIAAPKSGTPSTPDDNPPYNPPSNPPGDNPPGDNPPGENPPGDNPPADNPPLEWVPDEEPPLGNIDFPVIIPGTPVPQGSATPTLPQTGQLWWPVPLMAVAGMICFAAGWKRRYEN